MKFSEMNLKPETIKALQDMFGSNASATKIQEKSIPTALKGGNVIAQARTGSGKTLAFSIPIIDQLKFEKKPEVLILVPTRELCKQVAEVFEQLGKYTPNVKLVQVYGGVSIQNQIKKLHQGANVIVATPGRLIDLYERKELTFEKLKFVVLDEADRMLDMGFIPDIQYVMSKIHSKPQLLLFSATIIDEIKQLSNQFTGGSYSDINVSKDSMTVGSTKQFFYMIPHFSDKIYMFIRILRKEKPKHCLIFTNTKKTADWLMGRLQREKGMNLKLGILSGNMSQFKREQVTNQFKDHKINCLIATDVAARGLDIPNVSHVINYDVPQYEENYVHRIGRTSRMGKEGTALTLCVQDEYIYLCRIEGFIGKTIKRREAPPRSSKSRGAPSQHKDSYRGGNRSGNQRRDSYSRGSDRNRSEQRKRLPFF
ncbi:MAG: DEAD/DEAH box helicase [archaeon]|nr:DEAD/DEAH box helicase [archaeon]